MSKFAVILPAAGRSTRFSGKDQVRKKPFVELKGRAIWLRCAELFVSRDDVVQTILCVGTEDMEWFKNKFRPNLAFMDVEIVEGGAERVDTVQNALARVKSDVDFVAIHDAARPLLVKEWIDKIFAAAEKSGPVIPAVPVSGTLKRVGDGKRITETVSRENLWQAQTPQVFPRELLLHAFAKRDGFQATDEAQLMERIGVEVAVIEGWPMNIKITTQQDFEMAEALLNALPKKGLKTLHPFSDELI